MNELRGRLRARLRQLGSVLVCFSGGVDSGYVLAEAVSVLGARAVALTGVSPSLAPDEADAARALAVELGAEHVQVETHELEDARYAANPVDRCYFCKQTLYDLALAVAGERGLAAVVDGFNRDDRGDHRPGQRAARERSVHSPLDELGFTKPDVRAAAREMGLRVWDKPALACLASRFPTGHAISERELRRVGAAERAVRSRGFVVVRVRHHGDTARIEVGRDEVARLLELADSVRRDLEELGYRRVVVDAEGYRSGGANPRRSLPLVD